MTLSKRWRDSTFKSRTLVAVEILFCTADQTGNNAHYYDGDKVTAKSQGYNKQASTKERKTLINLCHLPLLVWVVLRQPPWVSRQHWATVYGQTPTVEYTLTSDLNSANTNIQSRAHIYMYKCTHACTHAWCMHIQIHMSTIEDNKQGQNK